MYAGLAPSDALALYAVISYLDCVAGIATCGLGHAHPVLVDALKRIFLLDQAKIYREQLLEKVSEADDALLEKYLGGAELSYEEIQHAIERVRRISSGASS